MKGTSDNLPNKLENLTSVKKTPGSPQPVHESKSKSKKVTKPKKKRPFGSIRCRMVRLTHIFAAYAIRTYWALSYQHILLHYKKKMCVSFLVQSVWLDRSVPLLAVGTLFRHDTIKGMSFTAVCPPPLLKLIITVDLINSVSQSSIKGKSDGCRLRP